MEEGRSAFKILSGKPLGRLSRGWEDNIRMDIKEIGTYPSEELRRFGSG